MFVSSDHDSHLQILSQLVEIHDNVFNCILFCSELVILNFNDQVVLDYLINSNFRCHGAFRILLIFTLFSWNAMLVLKFLCVHLPLSPFA